MSVIEPTPVFDETLEANPFRAFPTEYTDRYTPEVARKEGERCGVQKAFEFVVSLIDEEPKPTKQLLKLRQQILDMEIE